MRTEAWPSATKPLGESKTLAYPTTAGCSRRKSQEHGAGTGLDKA
jgi:hypothetical protein